MEIIVLIVVGLSIGSFLNVVIYRLPRNENLAFPRSHCPACNKQLRWFHNLPVISFLALRGRCAHCRAPISWRYPLVELATAGIFWLCWSHFGDQPLHALFCAIFLLILLVLSFIDLEHMILPDELTLGGAAVFLAYSFFHPGLSSPWTGVATALGAAAVFAGLFFFYIKVRGMEGLGFGDVKLMLMLGAFLGLEGLVVALLLASFFGLLVGGFMILFRGKDLKLALPFGPFLALGAFFSLFWGAKILGMIQSWVVVG
jgi:leader peptidase (prepilin peptidase)/N-methyltransferase